MQNHLNMAFCLIVMPIELERYTSYTLIVKLREKPMFIVSSDGEEEKVVQVSQTLTCLIKMA